MHRTSLYSTVVIAGLTILGCSSSPGSDATSIAASGVSDSVQLAPDDPLGDSLFDSTFDIESVVQRVFSKNEEMTASCMKAAGFDYLPIVYDPKVYAPPEPPSDPSAVRQFGYSAPPYSPPTTSPNAARISREPQYLEHLQQCHDDTYLLIVPSESEFNRLSELIAQERSQLIAAALASSQGAAVNHAWSECMSAAGYDYASPAEPLAQFAGDVLEETEVSVRITDLVCQQSVSYDRTLRQQEDELTRKWLIEHPTVAADYAAAVAEIDERIGSLE